MAVTSGCYSTEESYRRPSPHLPTTKWVLEGTVMLAKAGRRPRPQAIPWTSFPLTSARRPIKSCDVAGYCSSKLLALLTDYLF